MKYTKAIKEQLDKELQNYFDEWVPQSGKAKHQAGEVIRATMRLHYAYFNNGDRAYSRAWHNASTDYAADFLQDNTNSEIKELIWKAAESYGSGYERMLYQISEAVIRFVKENPLLQQQPAVDFLA